MLEETPAASLAAFDGLPLLLVGCGNMGGAMLDSWLRCGLPGGAVRVVQPSRRAAPRFAKAGVEFVARAEDLPPDFAPRQVVLAMRPNQFVESAASLRALNGAEGQGQYGALSVLAGVTCDTISENLPRARSVYRAMPNVGVEVLASVSACYAPPEANAQDCGRSRVLFEALGMLVPLETEEQFGLATALAGAGPAYVFLLAHALAQAGAELGLDPATADRLAREMIAVSGRVLRAREQDTFTLVREIALEGGVTEAALASGLEAELPKLIRRALDVGQARSQALGGG